MFQIDVDKFVEQSGVSVTPVFVVHIERVNAGLLDDSYLCSS